MTTAIDWKSAALLIVDPQVDVLSPEGAIWDLIGDQVSRFGIVDKLVALRKAAEAASAPVAYASLSVTEDDYRRWKPRNGLQKLMADRKMMLPNAGGRFHPRLEPGPATIVLKPRKGPSPTESDLYEQLRRRGLETVVIAGMIANLCVEAHVREGVEAGFNFIVVSDAVATTDDASLAAAQGSFQLLATGVTTVAEVIDSLRARAA